MNEKALEALHEAVCEYLLMRIKSGDAISGDISNAIRFLKDNGVLFKQPIENQATEIIIDLPDDDEIEALLK